MDGIKRSREEKTDSAGSHFRAGLAKTILDPLPKIVRGLIERHMEKKKKIIVIWRIHIFWSTGNVEGFNSEEASGGVK